MKSESTFRQNSSRYLEEWKRLLEFPSISADPEHEKDCVDCAVWLREHFLGMGMDARLLETPAQPAVFAEYGAGEGSPEVLFYGHYDVQPVDPLDQWQTPPFEPEVRNGRVYARGAQDNKGQLFYTLKAVETLIREGADVGKIKILLEGGEECGSAGLSEILPGLSDLVRADVLMTTDACTAATHAPTIIMGLRGVMHLCATLKGPVHDLHSGIHGGKAPNPAQGMAELVASLHNSDGSIAVEDFYRSVRVPTERERSLANAVRFDEAQYRADVGVPPCAGESGKYTPAERIGFRPTIDINGIHSGYGGNGMKTIIPADASAKITSRLVADQDPEFCMRALVRHLEAHKPEGLSLEISEEHIGGGALRLDIDSPVTGMAEQVLSRVTQQHVAFLWEGASIPVLGELARVADATPLISGFGWEEDNMHAPNESFSIERFRLGYLYVIDMLTTLWNSDLA